MTEYVGVRRVKAYLRLFPIWRFGPRTSWFTGERIADGWYPDRYEYRDA